MTHLIKTSAVFAAGVIVTAAGFAVFARPAHETATAGVPAGGGQPAKQLSGNAAIPVDAASAGEKGLDYVIGEAGRLVRQWRPLPLRAVPGLVDDEHPEKSDEIFLASCNRDRIWTSTLNIQNRTGEIPSVLSTQLGRIAYQEIGQQSDESGKVIVVGVRLEDRACGSVMVSPGSILTTSGDPDVAAAVLASSAVRIAGGFEARDHPLTPDLRDAALQKLAELRGDAAGHSQALRTYSASEFRELLAGKSKNEVIQILGKPLSIDDGVVPGSQMYDYSPAETYKGTVSFRVVDDTTGMTVRFVTITFGPADTVIGISL